MEVDDAGGKCGVGRIHMPQASSFGLWVHGAPALLWMADGIVINVLEKKQEHGSFIHWGSALSAFLGGRNSPPFPLSKFLVFVVRQISNRSFFESK
jgi:hypothetical protein